MATAGIDEGPEVEARRGMATHLPIVPRWRDGIGPQALGFGPEAEPMPVDWDGRGRPWLLVTARVGPAGHRTRLYRPVEGGDDDGAPVFDEGRDLAELDGLRLPCPVPNGRESRFDLVALAGEGLVLLPNGGSGDEPSFGDRRVLDLPADLGLGGGRVVQMLPVDWDGDGRVDLLISFEGLEGYWPDPQVPPLQQVGIDARGLHPGFDDDGRWRGRPPIPRVVWARNVGEAGEVRFETPVPIDAGELVGELGGRPAALLVAWGGGGAEVVLADGAGAVRFYRNFGGQLPPVLMEPRPLRDERGAPLRLPEDRTAVVAGDLDGDRRSELIFGRADGRVFAVRSGRGRDSGAIVGPIRQEGEAVRLGGGAVVTVGDLDGDGGIDLVVGDAAGRLHWLMDAGPDDDRRYEAPVPIEALGEPFRLVPGVDGLRNGPADPPLGHARPTLIDWKGNGRPDLIVGGAGGEVLFLRNNGHVLQPRYDAPEPLRDEERRPILTTPLLRPAAVDWTGTGLPDLIATDFQGFLRVWPRTEAGGLGDPVPLFDPFGRVIRLDGAFGLGGGACLWAGPWTGSGRPDLLVGLPAASRFVVPAMTGEPLVDLMDVSNVVLLEHLGENVVRPRQVRRADGGPVVVGEAACSPVGVDWLARGSLDLLIGADDGSLFVFPREQLRW